MNILHTPRERALAVQISGKRRPFSSCITGEKEKNLKKALTFVKACRIIVIVPLADVAHLVERHLAKVEVASSSLVVRSRLKSPDRSSVRAFCLPRAGFPRGIPPSSPIPAQNRQKSRERNRLFSSGFLRPSQRGNLHKNKKKWYTISASVLQGLDAGRKKRLAPSPAGRDDSEIQGWPGTRKEIERTEPQGGPSPANPRSEVRENGYKK